MPKVTFFILLAVSIIAARIALKLSSQQKKQSVLDIENMNNA